MQQGDLFLCEVEKIDNNVVFVNLPNGKKWTILSSEIAPGRIKNMRQYVVPNKKVVCKILRLSGENVDLSLRRVTAKERKEVMDKHKQEQTSKSAIHSIIKENAKEVEEKILSDFPSLFEFLTQAREDDSLVDKYIPKEYHEAIKKITQKKRKQVELSHLIKLKCLETDGIQRIKNIFPKDESIKITYISAGNFQLKLLADDFKKGKQDMKEILEKIEESSKKNKCECEFVEQ